MRGRWHVAALAAAPLLVGASGNGPEPRDAGWELVWADEFEAARLDRESWTVEVMPDPYNEELQYYPDRADDAAGANVWLEDGVLVIEAREEKYEHRDYTSARIKTEGKREFLYGRFEARVELPAETGMWPAFWLLGANVDDVGWPACGEIDVMEGKGRLPDWTSGAIHRGPTPQENRITVAEYTLPTGNFHDTWHQVAVEWEPGEIRWYVDDALFQTAAPRPGDAEAYWPFDAGHPFFIILNLAVGGWFDPGHPPPPGMGPQRFLVDYVRVYQRSGRPAAPGADGTLVDAAAAPPWRTMNGRVNSVARR
jgi:beta-glucanase (GH16 family)